MKHQIISQVVASDRNIYLTIEDGSLVSVNYSQGVGDIDLDFLHGHNERMTNYVIREIDKAGEDLYSAEFFFPSPYIDEQVDAIDDAIWKLIREENERAELIKQIQQLEQQLLELKARI